MLWDEVFWYGQWTATCSSNAMANFAVNSCSARVQAMEVLSFNTQMTVVPFARARRSFTHPCSP